MKWIIIIMSLYLVYYTFVYSKMVWKDGHKFAGAIVMMMIGGSLLTLPIWLYFINR
ncbi:hypothetical protein ACOI1C_16445 [Bacillus sp. DJP31]|uniref:hypothetical protein n=1 Tax=Bacillus sp. DJP31 TaxID=3409789 RepID=UPI003BB4D03E